MSHNRLMSECWWPQGFPALSNHEFTFPSMELERELAPGPGRRWAANFIYRPGVCKQEYGIIASRKTLSVERGEQALFDDIRYFFYITNRMDLEAEIVLLANQRCNQENLIAQLKSGVQAISMPVDDQTSNWA